MPEKSNEKILNHPVWHALRGPHAAFSLEDSGVQKYRSEIAPFFAVANGEAQWQKPLSSMLKVNEEVVCVGDLDVTDLKEVCLVSQTIADQMIYRREAHAAQSKLPITKLSEHHAESMVRLTSIAFPGYFREQTWRLGNYYGIFHDRELIAMAGERMRLGTFQELSAICTHPDHTGKGYAAALTRQLIQDATLKGITPFLHVGHQNARAIELYQRMGFELRASLNIYLFALRR